MKAAIKLYENPNPMMRSVRMFLERAWGEKGFSLLVKEVWGGTRDQSEFGYSRSRTSCSSQQVPEKRISRHQVRKK